jgi:hypothetical protein
MIFNKLLNHRLSFPITSATRSIIIQSDFDLASQMKLLNNEKQFTKALELFDKYKKNNIKSSSSFVITQALKACAHIEDLERGSIIHQHILSRIKNDSYISATLIYLYSKFKQNILFYFIFLCCWSAMWWCILCWIIIR